MANEILFETTIDKYDFGPYFYTVVYVGSDITDQLPMDKYPRLRVEATVDGYPSKGALMPDKIGSKQTEHLLNKSYTKRGERIWYFQVPKKVLKEISKELGDSVEVKISVGNQDEVEIHPAMEDFLRENDTVNQKWETLTPGKKRSLAYPVLKAKTDITLEKRLIELEEALLNL